MKRHLLLTIFFVSFIVSTMAHGRDLFDNGALPKNSLLTPSKTTLLTATYFNPISQTAQDSVKLSREQQLSKLPGYKLPKKALFFSAVIPGAGELFVGSYWKAAAFFLAEVGAWTYYGVNHKKGKDKEDEYEVFADDYWNPDKWLSWYNGLDDNTKNTFTHAGHMLDLLNEGKRTQQYYEMIGKYSEFVVGWEGARTDLTLDELLEYRKNEIPIADDYMEMRAESNDLLRRARTGTTIAMINHLLSAIDAAWTAKIHNNRLLKTALKMEQIHFDNYIQPVLTLKMEW
ncbi:MAG TPA: hypothetical protein ENN22_10150 [bacterium]|nr:hypothetical protein [bacterium]